MNKISLLRPVNIILFFSFVVQAATSVILFFHLKTPYTKLVFEIHVYNGIFMILLATAHIVLNWGWMKANFLRKHK